MNYKKRSVGANWGGWLGSKAGEWLGGAAQRIVGLGDYTVRKNVFMGGRLPTITNPVSIGGNTIRFQEYLGDIVTSGMYWLDGSISNLKVIIGINYF